MVYRDVMITTPDILIGNLFITFAYVHPLRSSLLFNLITFMMLMTCLCPLLE